MKRMLLVASVLLAAAACGGGGAGAPDASTSPATQEAPPAPVEWQRDYDTPDEMLEELRAGGVKCETEDGSFSTVYSERSLFCYTVPTRDEGYTFSVYATGEQQGEAHATLTSQNPGTKYVWGTGWSVAVPYGSDGSEVVRALGGEVG